MTEYVNRYLEHSINRELSTPEQYMEQLLKEDCQKVVPNDTAVVDCLRSRTNMIDDQEKNATV